jgi:hypothetical protein
MFCKPRSHRSPTQVLLAACLLLGPAFGSGCAGNAHANEQPADASVEIPEGALPGAVEIAFLPGDARPDEIAMPCVFVSPSK